MAAKVTVNFDRVKYANLVNHSKCTGVTSISITKNALKINYLLASDKLSVYT